MTGARKQEKDGGGGDRTAVNAVKLEVELSLRGTCRRMVCGFGNWGGTTTGGWGWQPNGDRSGWLGWNCCRAGRIEGCFEE